MKTRPTHTRPAAALAAFAIILGVLTSCANDDPETANSQNATTTEAPSVETTTPQPEILEPDFAADEIGPYGVGRTVVQMTDTSRDRTLDVDIWYPIEAGTEGTPARYAFTPDIYFDSDVAIDTPEISKDGPFPLVVYSHGSGGLRWVSTFFTENLASHGFVVIAPDHTGNTAIDQITGAETSRDVTSINRVLDSQFVITDMLQKNGTEGDPFAGSVDPERIGITGHSFGGFTSLTTPTGFTNAEGTAPPDPRIKVVVAMAPATRFIPDDLLASLNVPTMVITGTKDITTPIDPNTNRVSELVTARPLMRVDITDGGHQSFTDICDYQRRIPTIENVPEVLVTTVNDFAVEGCAADLIDIERAHSIIDTFTISFLETFLAGDSTYGNVLTAAGAAAIPEVEFSVTE